MARIDKSAVLGLILAGGQSRRMQGLEKSLVEFHGRRLIEHVFDRLTGQVGEIVVNANGAPDRFSFLDVPIVADRIAGYAGPLAGIHAGLDWCRRNRTHISHVLSVAADTPFFPTNLAAEFCSAIGPNEIGLAASNNRRHPVFGLWPVSLAGDLENFLHGEDRKVMMFVQNHVHSTVDFSESDGTGELDPFFNINTPDDLQLAAEARGNIAI